MNKRKAEKAIRAIKILSKIFNNSGYSINFENVDIVLRGKKFDVRGNKTN